MRCSMYVCRLTATACRFIRPAWAAEVKESPDPCAIHWLLHAALPWCCRRVFPCATPAEVRSQLPGDADVVAFQCRNPVHRAHYELFTRALHAPNVRPGAVCLVHPTCGPTQVGVEYGAWMGFGEGNSISHESCQIPCRPCTQSDDSNVMDAVGQHTPHPCSRRCVDTCRKGALLQVLPTQRCCLPSHIHLAWRPLKCMYPGRMLVCARSSLRRPLLFLPCRTMTSLALSATTRMRC